jgi:hypothetical protein
MVASRSGCEDDDEAAVGRTATLPSLLELYRIIVL